MTEEQRDELLLSMKNQMDTLTAKVLEHDKVLFELKHDVKEIKKDNRSISRCVAGLEVKVERGLDLLVDGYNGIQQKLDSFNGRFESDEDKLEGHHNRIWRLESKFGIA